MYTRELIEIQKDLEAEMRGGAVTRFHKRHDRAVEKRFFGESVVGTSILRKIITPFAAAIDQWADHALSGKAGRRHIAALLVKEFADTDAMAYIFAKNVINSVPMLQHKQGSASRTGVILTATAAIHDELRLRFFEENHKSIFRSIMKDCDTRNLPRHRRKEVYKKQFKYMQIEWQAENWTTSNRVHLGITLLEILKDVTGMIKFGELRMSNGKRRAVVDATQEMIEMMQERLQNMEEMFPIYYPMVVKPQPWSNDQLIGSAYLTSNVKPYKLIKRAKINYLSELENTDITVTINAVNALQETPWRVNSEMLEALRFVYENSMQIDKLPPANDLPLPPMPKNIEKGTTEYARNMAMCAQVHQTNRKFISKRLTLLQVIGLAERFKQFPEIYFPHDLCSRGRAYPKPQYLNPQGPAYVRSLLEFADGKPVETMEQVEFIAIAGANAYGHDKLPLKERIQWAWDNEDMFVQIADNWREDLRWTKADSPFEFLRFCLEWRGLNDEGVGYISHLPINFDATCSGLQHFSALLKDKVGGFNVNLTSHPERQDIYGAVAREAKKRIEADLDHPEKAALAKAALELKVDRKLTKRPVMIVPYSGTFKACMRYVTDHYMELKDNGVAMPLTEEDIQYRLVPYVSRHVWDSIGETVIAAREAMDWITKIARLVTKNDKPLPFMWSTPTGFVVQQAKYHMDKNVVQTRFDGRLIKVDFLTDSKTLDSNKNAQSLSPNFIHSMDAAHLQLTINKAQKSGRDMSFSMIHDSFGVHAADMEYFLHECIKPCFYEMYKDGNVLEKFFEEIKPLIPEGSDIPEMPKLGELDVAEVLRSEFFFS
ncbi:RNA polymerase [Roseobacter phage CRP-804]|uniref:DNA-directed RNA polymerase n=1 Tax=Roseobacter phage CRP-804 TaxID=3072850 RepID=A0AAX3ZV40_9CAUD|nr:RNA polymerase [Roseobacter phage CRP-804]